MEHLDIDRRKEGPVLYVSLSGRLDVNTAPRLKEAMEGELTGLSAVEMDLEKLEYISSAGLRVLLSLHRQCQEGGAELSIRNANDVIRDIFEITGFVDVLHIR